MWKDPLTIFNNPIFCIRDYDMLDRTNFGQNDCLSNFKLKIVGNDGTIEKHRCCDYNASIAVLQRLFFELQREFLRLKEMDLSDLEKSMLIKDLIYNQCVSTAMMLEKTGSYGTIYNFHAILFLLEAGVFFDLDKRDFTKDLMQEKLFTSESACIYLVHIYTLAIHLMVGSESKLLVGVRSDKPAWQEVNPPISANDDLIKILMACQLRCIGQEDVDFMPDPRTLISVIGSDQIPKFKGLDYRYLLDLLEDSYEHTHYLVNPEGVQVQIDNFPPVKSVKLKLKSSLEGPDASFGFIAVIETDHGNVVHVGNSVEETFRLCVENPKMVRENTCSVVDFYQFLVVQIYHDLVTAKEIEVKSRHKKNKPQKFANEPRQKLVEVKLDKPAFQFTIIPRTYQGAQKEARIPCANPRNSYTAHHVSGHIRGVRMSDEQRQRVMEFEAQYGIQILKYVPTGYTIVMPHISPRDSGINVGDLPRYIKLRMEDDLRRAFEKYQPQG